MNEMPSLNPMQEIMKKQSEEMHRLNNLNADLESERDRYEAALTKIIDLTDLAQIVGVAKHALNVKVKARRTLNDKIVQNLEAIKTDLMKKDEMVLKVVSLHQAHLKDPGDTEIVEECEKALINWLNSRAA